MRINNIEDLEATDIIVNKYILLYKTTYRLHNRFISNYDMTRDYNRVFPEEIDNLIVIDLVTEKIINIINNERVLIQLVGSSVPKKLVAYKDPKNSEYVNCLSPRENELDAHLFTSDRKIYHYTPNKQLTYISRQTSIIDVTTSNIVTFNTDDEEFSCEVRLIDYTGKVTELDTLYTILKETKTVYYDKCNISRYKIKDTQELPQNCSYVCEVKGEFMFLGDTLVAFELENETQDKINNAKADIYTSPEIMNIHVKYQTNENRQYNNYTEHTDEYLAYNPIADETCLVLDILGVDMTCVIV